jgi:hypothetical protein
MKVIRAFIEPILEDALEQERIRRQGALDDHGKVKSQNPEDASSLLGYLVASTEGI